jgi:bifunctional enzyme CysN/CysC
VAHRSKLAGLDIAAYLQQHEHKELLRFLTCGSVDDGKSTLIGRLLYDAKMIYEDQLASMRRGAAAGEAAGEFDPALLTDGLKAEREQGITIDVAYRYFSTDKRKFIIADTPGHEQYTRNMATGASNCDLAVILIDARNGVLTQTKRHSFIVSLLGIQHVLVAVNKMDLVDYDETVYDRIVADYEEFAVRLEVGDLEFIPLSALHGDNVVEPSKHMSWYQGPSLMHYLESVYIGADRNLRDFRFPVQYVNRPSGSDFRGYCGTVASGIVRKGDEILVLPSRKRSRVRSIVAYEDELEEAFAPQAVTLVLDDEIDVGRGDMIVRPGNVPQLRESFDATLVWMAEDPMVPGKEYLFKQASKTVSGTVATLRHRIDVNTLHRKAAPTLTLNEIGRCQIKLSGPLAFDGYQRNRTTGAFVVIDRITNTTVGAGMILEQRAEDQLDDPWSVQPHTRPATESSRVTDAERLDRFGQTPVTVLLTGLPGSGKSTTAYALERRLFDQGRAVTVLDGQRLRGGLTRDLGFSERERSENLRRAAEVAKLFNETGLICICAFVAPSEDVRARARELAGGAQRFLVVHLDAPVEVCRQRDTEGLYAAADAGELPNFPGVSAVYERPASPDLVVDTATNDVSATVDAIIALLEQRDIV